MALPDPDQVPRRAAPPRRAAARPRVRDEGLLLLRRRRRRARRAPTTPTATPTSGSSTGSGSTTSSSSAMSGAMGGSRSEEFLTPAENGEDTYVRCTNCDYAANVEARAHPGARRARRTTTCPPRTSRTRRTRPTIETLVALANGRDDLRRADRDWTAADTLKNVVVKLRHPDGKTEAARHRPARRPRGRRSSGSRRRSCTGRGRAVHRGGLRRPPRPGPRLHRPGRAGRRQAGRRALPARPAGRRGHPVDHRRQRAGPARLRPGGRPRLHRRRHDRGGRGARGRPLPQRATEAPWSSRAASRWATSSSSAASTPRRSTSRCSTRTASRSSSRWGPTASASRARSPRSPRRPMTTSGCAGRARSRPPTCTWSPPARTTRSSTRPQTLADDLVAQGLTVLYDDRRGVSPGVKFKDAELLGMPTIVVVGRGLADGVDRGARPAYRRARGRAGRRGRGAHRRGCPSVTARHRRGGHLRLGRHADALAHDRPARAVAALRRGLRPDARRTSSPARLLAAEDDGLAGRPRRTSARHPRRDASAAVGVEPAGERHERALAAYHEFWEPHTYTDPDVPALLAGLRERGIKVGVLSNTLWTRELPRGRSSAATACST